MKKGFGIRHSAFGKRPRLMARALLVTAIFFLNPESQILTPAFAYQPIITDSRIKTLVYNPNEVFAITTHYGYQSNIEFGAKETIETISVGDRVAWQISPAGRRLFIRAQEENAHTNMTIVTNLRAYQFDLRSSGADAVFGSEELTYVVRFFYPDDALAGAPMPPITYTPPPAVAPQLAAAPQPQPQAALPPAAMPQQQQSPAPAPAPAAKNPAPISTGTIPTVSVPPTPQPIFNYRYTYSGEPTVAPVKIFDDGKSTYFKFANPGAAPQISVITAKGDSLNIPTRVTSDGLVAVSAIAQRFSLNLSGQRVLVYNEANNKVM